MTFFACIERIPVQSKRLVDPVLKVVDSLDKECTTMRELQTFSKVSVVFSPSKISRQNQQDAAALMM